MYGAVMWLYFLQKEIYPHF